MLKHDDTSKYLMQPYTPHGDSNAIAVRFAHFRTDATLYPSRGQQLHGLYRLQVLFLMQPYTPHGDSNMFSVPS